MDENKEKIEMNENIENTNEEVTSLLDDVKKEAKEVKEVDKKEKEIEFKLDSLSLSKSNILNILEDLRVIKKRFIHIENIIRESERAQYSPSRDLPGVTGVYDGEFMLSADGVKHIVPKNYAAKSLLVFGDELKMMEQEGKVAFKVVKKVPRKKIEGLLSKKDGRYVILSDSGTFNLLKTAVEFRNIKQGEWVLAVIPETGPHNNFAAIDKVIKKEGKKEVKFFEKPKTESTKPIHTQSVLNKPTSVNSNAPRSSQPNPSQSTPESKSPMPKIQFSDDDLV